MDDKLGVVKMFKDCQTVTTELRTLEQRLVGSAVSAGAMDDANEAMAKDREHST